MRIFYKVVRGRVIYKSKTFNAGELIFALPEEISDLVGGGDIVRVPDNEFPRESPPFFLDKVDSEGSENQFNSTNILEFLSSIYSILATKPSLQQVRDAIKAPAAELGLGSVTIISDFTIPASGDVIVNPSSRNFLNEGDFIFGNISGVEGVLSRNDDIYTFDRQKSGTAISITGGISSFYPLRSNQIIFSVSTIEALRNRPFVTTDEKVFVNGKISVSDGLWGIYRADLNDTTSIDDGLLVIVSFAGTRWKRIAYADVLSIASSATLGGVKIGSGITIDSAGTISVPNINPLTPATSVTLGGVKIGSGITIDNAGTISVPNINPLTPATSVTLGGVKIGSGITIDNAGILSSFKYTNRIYVSPQGSDDNDGRSPETALRSIKAAARLATTTTEVESIYVGTGEFIEDNPIYLPPGTAVIGDNLRRTILKPLNEGRDFFWWSSGCYVNYLVFQDNYFGGFGKLDTSNQVNDRVFPATGLSFNLFPGHNLQRLPGVYKDGAGLIAFQRNSIINSAYSYMISLNLGLVIPGGGEATCKRDIGYFVDAISNDLKAGGNVNSIKAGKAYRDTNGDLIATIAGEVVQTKQAFNKAKDLCKTAIMTVPNGYGTVDISNPGACTQVSDTIESLSNLIISLIDGGDTPQYNSGYGYILVDQEWIEVLDIQGNTVTIADTGKRGVTNPITGDNSTPDKHINGAIVSQAGRAFRYAVAFPDQGGYWGKGRISINGSTVTGVNTNFTKEAFVGWTLKVGNVSYAIQSINSNTSITLSNSVASISSKAYKVVPKKEQIFLSPYIQNCSNISVLGRAVYDSATQSYDANKTRAGGMLVDNLQLDNKTPIPSNVADAFTQIAFGGIGFHHKNDGYSQLVSVFQVFDSVGILCESGAYTSVTNSATNFGSEGLKAIGFSNNAIPSFKNGTATSIINQTKVGFNNSPTNILSSTFASESGGTKTKAIITVANVDIGKFEAGQTITIAGHTSTPSINGVGLIISGLNFSANTIEVIYNTTFPNTRVNGVATGTITVTSGKLETKVTVSGFLENPLPNYIVKITGLANHPSGTEYVINNVYQPLENGVCAFTLQQTIPTEVLSALAPNRPLELRAPSTVNSSSHTYEYVGAGINYTALPINGGRTDKSKQAVEINSGKCYVSATDQDGNFNVGNYFNVDLRTGQITFAGQLNLGVIDALELLASPGVPIYEFVTSVRSQISAKNTAIATEKGVRDFVVANLGSLFLKEPTTSGGTSASAGQLVQLTSEGVIDSSMVRIPASNVYTVANQAARLVTSLNGIPLKAGDYVVQLNPAPATKYILTALPATNSANWDVFSVDNFDASAIVSGLLSAARLGTGTANTNTFLSGGGTFAPIVQNLKPAANSSILVGTEGGTTPVSNGQAGFLEIDVTKAAYVSGQTSGSSSSGVAKFTYDDFNITSNVVSIKDKFKSAATPLNFNPSTGELTIQSASTTQTGALTSTDWTTFNNKEPAISAGTATQYWSGTKSWATLNTTNVTEGTNLYFTQSRALATTLTGLGTGTNTAITSANTLITALQNLQAQITAGLSSTTIATSSVLGSVKVGSGLAVTGDGTVSITATSNVQSGSTYTIAASDNDLIIELTNATSVTVTLPNNLPAGFSCAIMQSNTATVTIVAALGATLNNARSHTKLFGQWAMATLYVRANTGTNAVWLLSGDTKA